MKDDKSLDVHYEKVKNRNFGEAIRQGHTAALESIRDFFIDMRNEMIENGEYEKIFGYTPKIDKNES